MVLQFLKQTHRMEPQKTLSLQAATTSAWPCSFFHVLLKLTSSSVFQCFMCGISSGRQVLLVLEVLWWFSMRKALKTTSPVTKRVTGGQKCLGLKRWETFQADTSQWLVSLMWKAERKTTFLIKRKLQLWKNFVKHFQKVNVQRRLRWQNTLRWGAAAMQEDKRGLQSLQKARKQ